MTFLGPGIGGALFRQAKPGMLKKTMLPLMSINLSRLLLSSGFWVY